MYHLFFLPNTPSEMSSKFTTKLNFIYNIGGIGGKAQKRYARSSSCYASLSGIRDSIMHSADEEIAEGKVSQEVSATGVVQVVFPDL